VAEPLILIDTSAWILALRKNGPRAARKRIGELLEVDSAATCGPVTLELLAGTRTPSEFRKLKSMIGAVHYLDCPEHIWLQASELAFGLKRKGVTVPSVDLVISQIAISNDCVLLHRDADFDRIAKFSSLRVEKL
jgi:predicted nucleic acid-binding protein